MMAITYSNHKYAITIVAEWFHLFPHVDITFSSVNATFDPTNNSYLEALGFLIAVPGFWLILTLLAFLIFFLCRCCDGNLKKKRKLTPLKWTLAIFALLGCGALSLGLFGNDQAHSGIMRVQDATRNMDQLVKAVQNETRQIHKYLRDEIHRDLKLLTIVFGRTPGNASFHGTLKEALSSMNSNLTNGMSKIESITTKADKVNIEPIPRVIYQIEIIRWPVTIASLSLLILVCLILLWGVIRHSRCLLILFSVLGLLSVVVCWVAVSAYVGICVATADFCLDPEPFLYKQTAGMIDRNILTYYIQCDTKEHNPFSGTVSDAKKAVNNIKDTLHQVTPIVASTPQEKEMLDQLRTKLAKSEQMIQGLNKLLDCQPVNKEFNIAMEGACTNGLEGTAFMLVSAAGAGLLFTILIWIASHTWIHIRKKLIREPTDEEDPFLPPSSAVSSTSRRSRESSSRPRYSHTPPQTLHFPSSLNGHNDSREDQTFLQGRYTPPPAPSYPTFIPFHQYDQWSGLQFFGKK